MNLDFFRFLCYKRGVKTGRNDPCPCGSSRKYKKCCYLKGESPAFVDEEEVFNQPVTTAIAECKDIIEDDSDGFPDFLFNAMTNIRKILLDRKPHIKAYNKIRKMHSDIVDAMSEYYFSGKFLYGTDADYVSPDKDTGHEKNVRLIESSFDLETRHGMQGLFEVMIYKISLNMKCITDEFIKLNRYRRPDKIEFLHSMRDSKAGLFEITGTEMEEGYAYLKNVFTGDEYKIIDIGLSGNLDCSNIYLYTRIITYNGISFGSGLNLVFKKTDIFIKDHIQQHKNNYTPNGEFLRFTQLYNQFAKYPDKIGITVNSL